MKQAKGEPGYIKRRKKAVIIKAALEFGIVIALLLLGYFQTKTRLNALTIVAVLGCLPASKALVEVIMILPHKTIGVELVKKIREKTSSLTVAYDLVLTSEKHIMPIECVLVSGNTICGYSSSEKIDLAFAEKHIKQYLYANQFIDVSVKIFGDEKAFLRRAVEMNENAMQKDTVQKEDAIRRVILNISL